MCEVILNDTVYNARFINRNTDRNIVRQGNFTFIGKEAFDAWTFEFENNMNFLGNLTSIIISSAENGILDNRNVIELYINDDNPQIVTFFLEI